MKKEIIVGINNSYFRDISDYSSDGNVAVMVDGQIRLAIATERITRKKYDGTFSESLSFALNYCNLSKDDVDGVSLVGFATSITDKFEHEIVKDPIYKYFGRKIRINYIASHHEAHAWGAIAQSGLKKALIIVLDHSGNIIEYSPQRNLETARAEQTSYYLWDNNKLELIGRDHDDFSELGYGRFYSKVTRYVGFSSYHHAGKLMGLAPIGKDISIGEELTAYKNIQGKETTALTHASHSEDGLEDLSFWFKENLNLQLNGPFDGSSFGKEQIYLARWAQTSLEQSVIRKIKPLCKKYKITDICITGGVALNSVMNGAIESETGCKVFIPSSPGDSGLAYGALAYYKNLIKDSPISLEKSPYLGPIYSEHEIIKALKEKEDQVSFYKTDNVIYDAAHRLHEGEIIAWFQSRSEYGPRALGNRSIIADPANAWIKEIVNHRLKKREWFRPFAPSVPAEFITNLFNTVKTGYEFMMKTAYVKPEIAKELASVIHYDKSARLQSVCKEQNPKFHQLIMTFSELGHLPVVMNTSFNLGDMPLVESPTDAIACFLSTDAIDTLFIHDFAVKKISLFK